MESSSDSSKSIKSEPREEVTTETAGEPKNVAKSQSSSTDSSEESGEEGNETSSGEEESKKESKDEESEQESEQEEDEKERQTSGSKPVVHEDAEASGVPFFEPASSEDQSSEGEPKQPSLPAEIVVEPLNLSPESVATSSNSKSPKTPSSAKKQKTKAKKATTNADPAYISEASKVPVPAPQEVQARQVNPDFITNGVAFPVTVVLSDGSTKQVHATADFTVTEFVALVAKALKMWQYQIWSVCQVSRDVDGCRMAVRADKKTIKAVNVVWLEPTATLEHCGIQKDSALHFRVKYWKHYFKFVDEVAIGLYYDQLNLEIMSNLHPVSSKHALRLAALQMQIGFGDFSRTRHKPGYFAEDDLTLFLPAAVLERNDAEFLQQRIFFYHRRLAGTSKVEAALAYIEEARNISTWGATWFDATIKGKKVHIAVCEDGFALPLKVSNYEETEKQRTVSRKALINTSRSTSIMHLNTITDTAALGQLHKKGTDNIYDFFPFASTYMEESTTGLKLQKKGESVQLETSRKNVDAILSITDTYMYILAKQGYGGLDNDELPAQATDCPNYMDFQLPMNRSEQKKESKATKTSLELLKENYLEITADASKVPNPRLLLQIDAKLDEQARLTEIDLRRCHMDDDSFKLIYEAISVTLKMVHAGSAQNMQFTQDFLPNEILMSSNYLVNPANLGELTLALRFTHIDLKSNNLNTEWAIEFAKSLMTCTSLVEINLSDNRLEDDGINGILTSLATLPALQSVYVSNVGISGGQFSENFGKTIAGIISNSPKIQKIDISDNIVTAKGIDLIVTALEKTSSISNRITEINLTNTHIYGPVSDRIAAWLSKCLKDPMNHLSVLKIGANAFTDSATAILAGLAAPITCHLVEVGFQHLKLKQSAMQTLLQGMEKNNSVNSLALDSNEINGKSGKPLGVMVSVNSTLTKLSLRNCAMDKGTLVYLGEALAKNKALLELDISGNSFESNKCSTTLSDALKSNKTLIHLNLAGCHLDGDSVEHVAIAIKANPTLQHLHLDANYIGSRGLRKLSQAIKNNRTIEALSLQNTDVKASDATSFLKEIGKTSNLNILDLRHNADIAKQSKEFAEAVVNYQHITIQYDRKR